MSVRFVLAPYHLRVSAAREIAEALDGMRIRPENSQYRPRRTDVLVNWGRSYLPYGGVAMLLNQPAAVELAINKILSLHMFNEVGIPTVQWTRSRVTATQWLADGHDIIVRSTVEGRGGEGITVVSPEEATVLPIAPLYTRYFKRKQEYRVHVFKGKVIFLQQKKLRNGTEKHAMTYKVRSYYNGWVFAHNDITVPDAVQQASITAVAALGLDFGAADVGWNEHDQRAAVFEVNSAPGIEGSTIEAYADAIRQAV